MRRQRIVTGNDENGKSVFTHQGESQGYLDVPRFYTEEMWVDDPVKKNIEGSFDPVDVDIVNLNPPVDGSCIRFLTFKPESEIPSLSDEELEQVMSRYNTGGVMETDNPGMHTTKTIDYGIVIDGEIYLELDEGEVHLKAGDLVVQRATRHAWRNRSSKPCTMAFILISSPNYQS